MSGDSKREKLNGIISLYERGALTLNEAMHGVLEFVDDETVGKLESFCPSELFEFLKKNISKFPADEDDKEWGRGWIHSSDGTGNSDEEKSHIRNGVKAFRKHFKLSE